MDSNLIYFSICLAYSYFATVAIMSLDAAEELAAMEFLTRKQEKLIERYIKRWHIYAVLSGMCVIVLLGRIALDIVRICTGV